MLNFQVAVVQEIKTCPQLQRNTIIQSFFAGESARSLTTATEVISKQVLGSTPWAMVNYRFIGLYMFCIILNVPGSRLPRKSWKDYFKSSGTEKR